ncbi:MAG: hypothetical protein HY775_09460 [Acidobacteria bacterium]|nr:hypothetical protein [Acidobacteriota bacterium]
MSEEAPRRGPDEKSRKDAEQVLREAFARDGYVRVPDLRRRQELGSSTFKKGWEVRLVADTEDELWLLRSCLLVVGFSPGASFRKVRRRVLPVYGRSAVEWFAPSSRGGAPGRAARRGNPGRPGRAARERRSVRLGATLEERVAAMLRTGGITGRRQRLLVQDPAELRRHMERLPVRERAILRDRLGMDGARPRTLAEIGEERGLTRERIRQLQAAGLRRIRDALE